MANYDASSTNKSKKAVRTYKDLDLDFTRHPVTNDVVKINIEFAYKYWRNMASTTKSLSFGRSTQAPADVKARDSGLFGMLPPELQRAGREVFGQARTVLNPIGRIFGGKVFPPFT